MNNPASSTPLTIRRSVLPTLVIAALLLVSCSRTPPEGSDPSATPGTWCETLTWATTSGEPGDTIPLAGTPADLQNVYAQVGAVDLKEPTRALVVEEPGSSPAQVALIVPIHPVTPFAGGPVSLTLTDGVQTCAAQPFAVSALPDPNDPEVQGTLERQAAEAQASLDQRAQVLGVDPASLKGDVTKLPTDALPLGLAQFFIDHPENPNSLAAIASRGSIFENGTFTPFDRKLMDALAFQFDFAKVLQASGELQTLQFNERCVGSIALSSPQRLNSCMNTSQQLQEINEGLAQISRIISFSLVPVLIFSPILSLPTLYLGFALYFTNATVLLNAQTSPRELATLAFTATPTFLLDETQAGSWTDVRVTVADTEPVDVAELARGMVDAISYSFIFPGLGPVFDRYISLILTALKESFEDDLNKIAVPYSTFGTVDITAFRESYAPSVANGDELQIVSAEQGIYAPSVPFRAGRADLILAIREGYFNDSKVQGARQITIGQPQDADEAFTIFSVKAPPVPYGTTGEVEVTWAGEGVAFPVELSVSVTDCSDFTDCELSTGIYEGRVNPLIYGIECFTNEPNPDTSVAGVTFSLKDSSGKVTPPFETTLTCSAPAGLGLEPKRDGSENIVRTVPF